MCVSCNGFTSWRVVWKLRSKIQTQISSFHLHYSYSCDFIYPQSHIFPSTRVRLRGLPHEHTTKVNKIFELNYPTRKLASLFTLSHSSTLPISLFSVDIKMSLKQSAWEFEEEWEAEEAWDLLPSMMTKIWNCEFLLCFGKELGELSRKIWIFSKKQKPFSSLSQRLISSPFSSFSVHWLNQARSPRPTLRHTSEVVDREREKHFNVQRSSLFTLQRAWSGRRQQSPSFVVCNLSVKIRGGKSSRECQNEDWRKVASHPFVISSSW